MISMKIVKLKNLWHGVWIYLLEMYFLTAYQRLILLILINSKETHKEKISSLRNLYKNH